MEEPVVVNKGEEALDLPPGFRFHPTDEEIITYYLMEKVMNCNFSATAIGEADLNKCEPWDLPKRAKMGEKEWYFFCQKDRKYPTGTRTNRATESGYWKATGKDKEIYKGKGNLVGMKKTLVFYRGRAPKGEKTNWVMHEFRLEGKFAAYRLPRAAKDEWVVCKIFHKNTEVRKIPIPELLRMNSLGDDLLDCSSLPPLMDPPFTNPGMPGYSGGDEFKGATLQPSSDGYYHPNFSINNSNHNQVMITKAEDCRNYEITPNYYHPNNSNPLSHAQIGGIQNPSLRLQQNNALLGGVGVGGVIKNENMSWGVDKQCNMEHSVLSVSQDTGLSNDINTETSSAVSMRRDIGRNKAVYEEDLIQAPSLGPLPDLDYLWDDY